MDGKTIFWICVGLYAAVVLAREYTLASRKARRNRAYERRWAMGWKSGKEVK